MRRVSESQKKSDHREEQTATRWSTLSRLQNVKQHIRSLDLWCFFGNDEINATKSKYLLLELEGVLLHITLVPPKTRCDYVIQYTIDNHVCTYFIILRPMLMEFLRAVSQWYTLVLYTTLDKELAEEILCRIEKGKKIFKEKYFRDDCIYVNNRYIKDISKVSEDLSQVVMLDVETLVYKNVLPIDPFTGDAKDRYLLSSSIILECLRYCADTRSILNLSKLK
ncbi:CTD nuclear envelope phosphatase 1 [Nematocida sp. AWRm80]|nr:CTD nuclear envelope phosphatase 1 [Nematocida sp. AWRm80]